MNTGGNTPAEKHARFPLARVLGLALLVGVAGTIAPLTVRFVEFRAGNSITDDAFLEAQMIHVGPDGVSGRIVRVAAGEDLFVPQGQMLFELDADQYRDQAAIAEAKVRMAEGEKIRQEIALGKLRRDVPLGIEEARQSLLLSKMTESRMEKVLRLTTDEVAGTVAESQALVGVAVANQTLAQQEYERFNALYKDNATTLRRSQEMTRTNEATLAELRLAHAKQDKATSSRTQIEVAAKDFEMARVATSKAALTMDIAENRVKTILEAEQALRVTEDAANEARALLRMARRHLANTRVIAPISGIVVRRAKATGDHASMGATVVTMYDPDLLYVTANLEETRMRGVAAGNTASIRVDALGRELRGRVLWINRSTGAEFSLLPRNVVSGEFSKVVQRVPVRILLDKDQDLSELRAGYSVRVTIAHGPGDPVWVRDALAESRRLDSRFDEPEEPSGGRAP
jgi:membrane fusion protein (multidrug efflux system)